MKCYVTCHGRTGVEGFVGPDGSGVRNPYLIDNEIELQRVIDVHLNHPLAQRPKKHTMDHIRVYREDGSLLYAARAEATA